jgi:putative glutamine amidotransferase
MSLPLIGITVKYTAATQESAAQFMVGDAYVEAVLRAGGLPVLVPPVLSGSALEALFERLDGLLLTGGGDIDPARFGGEAHQRIYGIEPRRDTLEIELVRLAAGRDKPFMGICRGIQAVNVALGGSLYTDLADQLPKALKHDYYPDIPRDHLAHAVSIDPDSRLVDILGSQTCPVNSLHHQGLQRLASGLRAVAFAPDGLVEAVELNGHPFGLGVQWHPECLQADPAHRALFKALVSAAAA